MTLKRAIKIISSYCLKHDCCEECKLYYDGDCIRHTVPCDWEDFLTDWVFNVDKYTEQTMFWYE